MSCVHSVSDWAKGVQAWTCHSTPDKVLAYTMIILYCLSFCLFHYYTAPVNGSLTFWCSGASNTSLSAPTMFGTLNQPTPHTMPW